jgi:hypothetical protein
MMTKLDDALQLDRIANNIANAIADQFSPDFCNDRMIEGFAETVKNHINALRLEQETKDTELRDHFAGLAMQGLLAADAKNNWNYGACAEHSYTAADAMLKVRAREKK